MKSRHLLICTALVCIESGQAFASEARSDAGDERASNQAKPAPAPATKAFNTGVAKGRDLLDTAISASTLDETDLPKLGTSAVVGIIGNLPGIRAETSGIDGFSAVTVRGLPLSDDGSKYIQIQEDGLPVLEFGDIKFSLPDTFIRADIGLSQVQAIRGGSASTFASNSPGGVINFISKTGETAGGTVQASAGVDHDLNRVDFEYGAPLGGGWRFHVGGFYREGEGPREIGYKGFRGGQVKFNVTRQFANGYVRVYGKYLDDHQPNYTLYPLRISGTNDAPTFANIAGTDIRSDGLQSPFTASFPRLDETNRPVAIDGRDGIHAKVRAVGLEGQFDFSGWTFTDKFRFSSIDGEYNQVTPLVVAPARALATQFAGPNATISFAGGPNAGQIVADPTTLGGNGLLILNLKLSHKLKSIDNLTNDFRTSRVWPLGGGKLTTSAGVYVSSQDLDQLRTFTSTVETLGKGGTIVPINLTNAAGTPITDNGLIAYGYAAVFPTGNLRSLVDARVRILAPYGSVNYQVGKLAVGGSVRFDRGHVGGELLGVNLGSGRVGTGVVDVNGNGVISRPESNVAVLPLTRPGKVDYNYRYTSYSVGANYRFAEPFSVFARYSKGGRAAAERPLLTAALNSTTGKLVDPASAFSPVKQAEAGIKLRSNGVTVFVTGFWASTLDKTVQTGADATGRVIVTQVDRTYSAKGVELEGDFRLGPVSLALGATYAQSKIDKDSTNAALVGNRPRHQPSLFFNARPQFEKGIVTLGATINGITSSFAQDTNVLKQPGYVVVSPFLFVRPVPRVQLGLNAFNVFDKLAFVNISAAAVPASGIVNAQVLNGRTITGSIRYSF